MSTTMSPGSRATPGTAKRRRPWGLVIGSAAAVGAFACGMLLGMDVVDPMDSDEYRTLQGTNSTLIKERDVLQDDYDTLQEDYDELQAGIADREAQIKELDSALQERSVELDERQEELAAQEKEVVEREKAVGKIEAEQEANSVGTGVWTVGQDIKAGTYRTKEPVSSDCYWAVLVSGTNGADIVNNGIPGGGRPKVTVKKGQDFESQRCGTWVKQ